ncbi:MAG TPA: cytochrome c [Oceanithermus profundus]|uniref:Cytochrome c n=1 Tax=Oceanithermus profundus TaxID=187137 RepID=A0A7C4VB75_9DEIN|nr:cytochrome c [Oceanithermus profundus]
MKKGILIALLLAGLAMAEELPKGPGVDLVYAKCQICHDLTYPLQNAGLSEADWEGIVDDMIDYGAPINEEERAVIIKYLATYLGPNPPPAEEAATAETTATVDGKAAYAANCAGCHQAEGQGVPGAFPPLKGNPVLVKDATYPALVVLFGLQGQIEVNGAAYNGAMPPLGHLDDATVAAAVNHVLQTFNAKLLPKDFKPLTPEDVAELRKKALSPAQVLELRKKLLNP